MANGAVVSRAGVFNNQVCVPEWYSDEEAIGFLNTQHPAGTTGGWFVDEELGRVKCAEREGFIHIVLFV